MKCPGDVLSEASRGVRQHLSTPLLVWQVWEVMGKGRQPGRRSFDGSTAPGQGQPG